MTIEITHTAIKGATEIEEVICLSVMIATGKLSTDSTIKDSARVYDGEYDSECGYCPAIKICLACIINE